MSDDRFDLSPLPSSELTSLLAGLPVQMPVSSGGVYSPEVAGLTAVVKNELNCKVRLSLHNRGLSEADLDAEEKPRTKRVGGATSLVRNFCLFSTEN